MGLRILTGRPISWSIRATHLRARVVAGNGADVGTWDCFHPLRIADDQALSQSARGQPTGDPSAHFTGGSGDRNQLWPAS
jgi:hypothetical protein